MENVHAVSGGEDPARLDQDSTAGVAKRIGRALFSGLQGHLPRVGARERFAPPEDPAAANGIGDATLGELGRVWFRFDRCGWSDDRD